MRLVSKKVKENVLKSKFLNSLINGRQSLMYAEYRSVSLKFTKRGRSLLFNGNLPLSIAVCYYYRSYTYKMARFSHFGKQIYQKVSGSI